MIFLLRNLLMLVWESCHKFSVEKRNSSIKVLNPHNDFYLMELISYYTRCITPKRVASWRD